MEEDIRKAEQFLIDFKNEKGEYEEWHRYTTIEELKAIENILQDYTKQKQINEEHKKEIAELREKVKELEEPKIIQDKNIRSGKPVIKGTRLTVIDVLLFITEFIKEHEKEFKENYADINSKEIVSSINYLLESTIPKQKIKEKFDNKIKDYRKQRMQLADGHFWESAENINKDTSLFIAVETLKEFKKELLGEE